MLPAILQLLSLPPAPPAVVPICDATQCTNWLDTASRAAGMARKLLSRNDVTVTNQSDKDGQLEKLSTLSEAVRVAFATPNSSALVADVESV